MSETETAKFTPRQHAAALRREAKSLRARAKLYEPQDELSQWIVAALILEQAAKALES